MSLPWAIIQSIAKKKAAKIAAKAVLFGNIGTICLVVTTSYEIWKFLYKHKNKIRREIHNLKSGYRLSYKGI
jgi:energy-converting hydrogenase Eha subunit C